jgi:hypothetical protein
MRRARAAGCRFPGLGTWLSSREPPRGWGGQEGRRALELAGGGAAGLNDWPDPRRQGRTFMRRGRGRAGDCVPCVPASFASAWGPWRLLLRREPGESGGPRSREASRRPGPSPRRRGPRVMAKGEGAESSSAAGLLPTGILQAGERPAQVKVRAQHPECRARGVDRPRWEHGDVRD